MVDDFARALSQRDQTLDQWLLALRREPEELERLRGAAGRFLATGDFAHEMPAVLVRQQRRVLELLAELGE